MIWYPYEQMMTMTMVPYILTDDELVHIFAVMKEWFRRG